LAYHWFGRTDRLARAKEMLFGGLARLSPGGMNVTLSARSAWHSQMRIEQQKVRKYPRAGLATSRG
jgi:hypothetical protein